MLTTILGTLAIVLVAVALGVAADRRWGLLPRKDRLLAAARPPALRPPAYAPGEAPASALDLRDAGPRALDALRHPRCPRCRAATEPLPDETVSYAGHELLLLHARCRECGHTRPTYARMS